MLDRTLAVSRRRFGELPDGTPVELFALSCGRTLELCATSYGGVITAIRVPDRDGRLDNIVLGHRELAPYLGDGAYLGALIGRCANRIGGARFALDGRVHELAANDGSHHLHGGPGGFHRRVWDVAIVKTSSSVGLLLTRVSDDEEEDYPGRLHARIAYTLLDSGDVVLDYEAVTDAPTVVNLTQHTYFNLAGRGSIHDHDLVLEADAFTPIDGALIPTGEVTDVSGTPFDFRHATAIGARIDEPHDQLAHAGGYDHNWVGTPSATRIGTGGVGARPRERSHPRALHN